MEWTLMVPVKGYYMHAVNKLEEFSDSVVHEQLMTSDALKLI
jgi:hypothetical protein